jgi:Cu/Ag efflux pump CusA
MTVAGLIIALGVIIDDVIIDVENISRRLRQAQETDKNISAATVIHAASLEMRGSIIYATLVMLLVTLPVFFIQGITGLFFLPLVSSYTIAILTSLVVALLVTPGFALLLLPKVTTATGPSPLVRGFEALYDRLVGFVIRRGTYAMFMVAALLLVIGLAILPFLNPNLVPSLKSTNLLIRWNAAPGTSVTAMHRTLVQISEELSGVAGVNNVSAHIGRAETGDQKVGMNAAELWVSLAPTADYAQTTAELNAITDGYPGVFGSVQTYLPARLEEALIGPDTDITVRVYGIDLDGVREKAAEVATQIAAINGVATAVTQQQEVEPQVEVKVNLDAAEQYGLKPGDVRRQATTLLSGTESL